MQPLDYLSSTIGLIWTIACVPLGFILTAAGYLILNKIPAKWLCDYDETPTEELLSGKRFRFLPSGIPISVLVSVCLVLCRLSFNKGYDIYFCIFALIIFTAVLIALADIKYQIIPDQFTIAVGVFGAAVSAYDIIRGFHILHSGWLSPVFGAAIGAGTMLLIDFIGMKLFHREGMGFGDVKLFFAVGLFTGFPGTIYAFIISVVTASIAFAVIILVSRLKGGASAGESDGEEKSEQTDSSEETKEASESEATEAENASESAENENVPDKAADESKSENVPDKAADESKSENVPDKAADENKSENSDENSSDEVSSDEVSSDEVSSDEVSSDEEEPSEDEQDGLGTYLAFGPYIAIALCAYASLFDLIQYLAGLYLNLFH